MGGSPAGVISFFYQAGSQDVRSLIRIVIAVMLIASELIKIIVICLTHGDLSTYMPLEVCSFASYSIVADVLIKGNKCC